MNIQGFHPHFSRTVLVQWVLFLLMSAALLTVFSDDLNKIYLSNSQTMTGLMLNGLILALFSIGMLRFVILLLHYQREEKALASFYKQFKSNPEQALEGITPHSMIAQRFETLKRMAESGSDINHQALASTLIASESTRSGLLRFVQNTLILCGVFGTIVSLSIALFGASDLLENSVSSTGMGMVIHGMSTALSTTMTAIVCYLSFAYFHGALQNVQTNFLSAVEHLTTTDLIPSMQVTESSIDRQLASLLKAMALLVQEMQQNQQAVPELLQHIEQLSQQQNKQYQGLSHDIQQIQSTLRQGFRLPEA